MPVVRFHLRSAHGISDPALHGSDGRDHPQALLQGVAAAGLTGILRQLGDLAEFAAEIFHELHKDVMSVVARGQGLTVRVQQLEAGYTAIEKILCTRSDHVNVHEGIDWHPSLPASHNLISLEDIPKFMLDSYEDCRGPPPLFRLDKFDSAGAGACLRRYSDPSFFKTNSSFSEVQVLEYQRERRNQKTKVEVMHSRDNEHIRFSSVLDVHAKLRTLTEYDRNNNLSNCTRLKITPPNHSYENSEDRDQQIIESFSPDSGILHTSGISIFENQEHVAMAIKDKEFLSCHQQYLTSGRNMEGETKLVESDELKILSPNAGKFNQMETLVRCATKVEQSPDRLSTAKLSVLSSMEVGRSANAKEKIDATSDGYVSADVSSDAETHNYVDALTTYESEHEADEKNIELTSPTMHSYSIGEQAFLGEASNNCCSKDNRSEIHGHLAAVYSSNLADATAKYINRNEGSVNAQEVQSTFNPLYTDSVLLTENGSRNAGADLSYARSATASLRGLETSKPGEKPEVFNTLSHEFGDGVMKIYINENGDSHFTLSRENYAGDVLSPSCIKLTGSSAEFLASSSPLPASTFSTTNRDYVQSENLCVHESVLRCSSSNANVIQVSEEAPSIPPLPPVEWRTGKFELGPTVLDITSVNTQSKSNSLLLNGEHKTQVVKCDNGNTSFPVEMSTTNSMPSRNCHSVSEEGAVQSTGSSEMMLMEEEEIKRPVPLLYFGKEQQLTPAIKDEKFVPVSEEHVNKMPPLITADSMTGLNVSEDSINEELPPPTAMLTAGQSHHCVSESPTPKLLVTTQHTSFYKPECESIVGSRAIPEEVDREVSNGKHHSPGNSLNDPLIEAIAAYDKSKFRKVLPVIKVSNKLVTDQRSALLEEIRNKAFTLRPVSLARPSIKGPPVTNSKLLDILVKANTIRQALAGSDEDDEENWQ